MTANKIAELEARIAKLELALVEAEKDTLRLNWIEAYPREAQIMVDGVITDCLFFGITCAPSLGCREAIDMASEGTSEIHN